MADLHFYCALCGHSIAIGSEHAGELVECDACQRVVPVPGFAPPPGGQREWLPAFAADILAVEIKFQCQSCSSKLRVDARWQGRKLKCPRCEAEGRVPTWIHSDHAKDKGLPALSPEEIAFLSGEELQPSRGASATA